MIKFVIRKVIITGIIIFLFTSNEYGLYSGLGSMDSDYSPNLIVLVPGINTNGQEMDNGAINMLRKIGYNDPTKVIIRQIDGWTNEQIKEKIIDAVQNAKDSHRDIVVLIDMDLEEFILKHEFDWLPFVSTKWHGATKWTGETINLVSSTYSDQCKGDDCTRYLEAHSAGVDGFSKSLEDNKGEKMFDDVYLLNGRTSAPKLARLLDEEGYVSDDVSVFLAKGDFPSRPRIPIFGGSMSNLDSVLSNSGKLWKIFYAEGLKDGHNDLRDRINTQTLFRAYDKNDYNYIVRSVEDLKLENRKKYRDIELPDMSTPTVPTPLPTTPVPTVPTPLPTITIPPCPNCDDENGGGGGALGGVDFTDMHLNSVYYNSSEFSYILKAKKAGYGDSAINIEDAVTLSLGSFFIGLTIPESEFWVNLNPWEPDRIIEKDLESTDVGRIMLEADLRMKKSFGKYEDPCESDIGEEYWKLLEEKRKDLVKNIVTKYNIEERNILFMPVTRHWIVPNKVDAYETDNDIYIINATLSISSEPVYEHSKYNVINQNSLSNDAKQELDSAAKEYGRYVKELEDKTILPLVVQDVNDDKDYSDLKQVYMSLVLAQWYKNKYRDEYGSSLFANFIDSKDLSDLNTSSTWSAENIWRDYKKSFEDGDYHCWKNQTYKQGEYIITESNMYSGGGVDFSNIKITNVGIVPDNLIDLMVEATYLSYAKDDNNYYFGDWISSEDLWYEEDINQKGDNQEDNGQEYYNQKEDKEDQSENRNTEKTDGFRVIESFIIICLITIYINRIKNYKKR